MGGCRRRRFARRPVGRPGLRSRVPRRTREAHRAGCLVGRVRGVGRSARSGHRHHRDVAGCRVAIDARRRSRPRGVPCRSGDSAEREARRDEDPPPQLRHDGLARRAHHLPRAAGGDRQRSGARRLRVRTRGLRRPEPHRPVAPPDPPESSTPRRPLPDQVEALGFHRDDVRHIITTHFDVDHIGGIADFPDAQIHVTAAEALGAMRPPTRREKARFRTSQWAHGPKIVEHDPDGETWRGFAAAKELDAIAPGIVLVSLPGHTRGHACVAVDAGHRWVLHCGDAFYYRGTLDGHSRVPVSIKLFEGIVSLRSEARARQPRPARRALRTARARPVHRLGPRSGPVGRSGRHQRAGLTRSSRAEPASPTRSPRNP